MNKQLDFTMTDDAFAKAVAAADQPTAVLDALADLVDRTVGVTLFTTMTRDQARGVARRNFSTRPDAYPTGGEKPITPNAWTEMVEHRHETFVANSIEEIAAVFSDHELIHSLGCESCLNLPIVVGGVVIGTLNCLNGPGHFTPERVAAAETLRLQGAIALMMVRTFETGDDNG